MWFCSSRVKSVSLLLICSFQWCRSIRIKGRKFLCTRSLWFDRTIPLHSASFQGTRGIWMTLFHYIISLNFRLGPASNSTRDSQNVFWTLLNTLVSAEGGNWLNDLIGWISNMGEIQITRQQGRLSWLKKWTIFGQSLMCNWIYVSESQGSLSCDFYNIHVNSKRGIVSSLLWREAMGPAPLRNPWGQRGLTGPERGKGMWRGSVFACFPHPCSDSCI